MLKKILIGLALAFGVFAIYVATRPAEFEIKRSLAMRAPPERVFAQVNDLKLWQRWSPWEGLDPALKRSYGGPSSGVGATYAWVGDDKVGEGKMTITDAQADRHVGMDLEFFKPFAAKNRAEFSFVPTGDSTTMEWKMTGTNNFMGKAFGVIMNMDSMVGADFEKGLEQLKSVVEAPLLP